MFCCELMKKHLQDGEVSILYLKKIREYGITINDGGTSFQEIYYCPWCGKKLPYTLRDEWFDKLQGKGLDPFTDEIPEEYKTDAWWKNK